MNDSTSVRPDFTPVRPSLQPVNLTRLARAKSFLNSGLALFLRGSYDFVGVSRHNWPRLPLSRQRASWMVRDPDAIRRVLVGDAARFPKAKLMDAILRVLTGYSIFVSNGEAWRRQRAIVDQAFENARVREVFDLMRDASDAMCARLDEKLGDGAAHILDIDVETMHFAGDVIFRTLYSEPMHEADARAIFTAFERFQGVAYRLGFFAIAGIPTWLLPGYWIALRDAQIIRRALNGPISRRLKACARGEATPEGDILAAFITGADPVTGTRFSPRELLDQVAMLFLAGHETSAAALGWALYMIANRPDIQTRMRVEADAALGDRAPQFSDLRRLPLVRDVFQETLRLYPPVAFLAREAAEPVTLCGEAIPQNGPVFLPAWLMQRNETFWKDAHNFNPDRFSDPATKTARACAYFPFSMGPRVCSGAAFALQEATLALAELVRRYEFAPAPGHEPEPVSRLTIRSANGVMLSVRRRASP